MRSPRTDRKGLPRNLLLLTGAFLLIAVIAIALTYRNLPSDKPDNGIAESTLPPTPDSMPQQEQQPTEPAASASASSGAPDGAAEGAEANPPLSSPDGSASSPGTDNEPSAPPNGDDASTIIDDSENASVKPPQSQTDDKPKPELTDEQRAAKTTIDAKYESRINELRSGCVSKSNQLLKSMIDQLVNDEKATLLSLQSKFLGKLLSAEASCDSRFQTLLGQATADYDEAGIPADNLPPWKAQYSTAKAEVRSAAIAKLASAMKS